MNISFVCEFLNYPETFSLSKGEEIGISMENKFFIELQNVSFKYPGSDAVIIKNINLELRSNEKIAIVGLNGAGKTTLIKLICGLLDPTEGSIYVNGVDIKKLNRTQYYGLISAVFQESCLPENEKLSTGQLQQKLIERAREKNGLIMILDEPTASLDPRAERRVYERYNEMAEGKISVFISHRLAPTLFCERILFMENGQIAEEGSHEELISKNCKYARLYNVQSHYYKAQEGL